MKKTLILLIVYFVLMFAPMFLGFLSPTLWFFYPVLSAFLAATPVLWGAKERKKFGGVAIFPLFWYLLMVLAGELGFPERLLAPLVIILLAELIRKQIGYEKQSGLRLSYAVSAIVTAMQHLIILTRTDFYYQGAVEEMGSTEYAEAIVSFGTAGWFALLLVLSFAAGYLGAVLSEKLFKTKVILDEA